MQTKVVKIDFSKIDAQVSFDGTRKLFDIRKDLGNTLMFNGSVYLDVGFEDLAKAIYYAKEGEEIAVADDFIPHIITCVKQSSFVASIKRELIKKLTDGSK